MHGTIDVRIPYQDFVTGRAVALPSVEIATTTSLSDDVIALWSFFSWDNIPAADIENLGWDIRRRCGDERGWELFSPLADKWSDHDVSSLWASYDRERVETDEFVMTELASIHNRGQLFELTQPAPDIRDAVICELDTLARLFDTLQCDAAAQAFHPLTHPGNAMPPLQPTSAIPTSGGMPLMAGTATIIDLGAPIIDGFIAGQSGRSPSSDGPRLPPSLADHALYNRLNETIGYILASASHAPSFRANAVVDPLAVLSAVHAETGQAVVARLRGAGCALPDGKINTAVRAFEARVHGALRSGAGWRLNVKGEPDPQNSDNVAVFLSMVGVSSRFNSWKHRIELRWKDSEWVALSDAELNRLRGIASREEYRFRPTKDFFRDMLIDHARQTTFDPVLDYVDGAAWDGKYRLATWLTLACGVECDIYHQALGKNIIGGIVKRVRNPGAKHDEVAIFIGAQGCGKSNLTKVLALDTEWHTDSIAFEGRPQDIIPQMHGRLVIELSELDGVHKRDVGYIKRFLSTQSDNFTAKYEALASDRPRRCIFIGTCNLENPLVDETGNRRFYPVRIPDGHQIDVEWLRGNIDQLIAEAAMLESAGETFSIPREVWAVAAGVQERARSISAVEELLLGWLANPDVAGTAGYFVLSADLVSALTMARQNSNAKVGGAMARLGYVAGRPYVNGSQQRAWVKSAAKDGKSVEGCVQLAPVQTLSGPIEMRMKRTI